MRKHIAALAVLPLLLLTAACGNDEVDVPEGSTPGVEVTGELGELPAVTASEVSVDSPITNETIKGDGPTVDLAKGALVHLSVFSGVDGKEIGSTVDANRPEQVNSASPEPIKGLWDALNGLNRGSRVVLTTDATEAVGAEVVKNWGLEEGNTIIVITDIMSVAPSDSLDGPEGAAKPAETGLPKIVEKDGKVTGLDWSDVGAKPKELQVVTLIEGTGPAVESGRLGTFNYFGKVWKAKKPFDESYSKEPATFPVGIGGLIPAWDEGLVGVKQGSRLMIIAPPDTAYGAQGGGDSIPPDSTLVFVIDVLGVDA